MTVFAETPHELVAVHLAVTIVVHSAEDDAEAADAVTSTLFQYSEDLLQDLIGRLTGRSEDRVDIRVVTATTDGEPGRELLKVKFVIAITVIFVKESAHFKFGKSTAHGLESPGELVELDGAEAIKVEVLKYLAYGLSFVVGAMCSLSYLFKDDILNLTKAISVYSDSCAL